MTHLVAWEKYRSYSEPLRTKAHRVTEELPRLGLCGVIVPELGDRADVIRRGDQVPDELEECKLCVALDAFGLAELEEAAAA